MKAPTSRPRASSPSASTPASAQKAAVSSGIFLGSITQDPYNIGYLAVELAYKAYKGEKVADVDTGAKFYTKDNINNPEIKDLVYD